MAAPTEIKHIVQDPTFYGGKPCIDNFKISVHDIAESHNQGLTPEQIIVEHYPELTLAQVYAALAYYYEHKAQIDREIAEEAEDIRTRAQADSSPLAERIRKAVADRKRQLGQ